MNSTISCPSCQRMLRVPESLLGQSVKCPTCSHTFTAPESLEEVAPRRPAPPPQDDYADEPRPSKRRARYDDYDDDDYEDVPRRRDAKPAKVQAIGIMMLVGGILAMLGSLGFLVYCVFIGLILGLATMGAGLLCCLWPGPYYGLVVGIMAAIKGTRLIGDKAYRETPPQGLGIMMIINIINGDIVNLVMGILILVFLSDEEVKDYFR